MKYNDIESVNDLIKYLDDGNTLTMSQVSFVANKLNIESRYLIVKEFFFCL